MIDYSIQDNIATLTISVDGSSMNVLNENSIKALEEVVPKTIDDETVKGVIITSDRKEFMAGADLKMFTKLSTAGEVLAVVNRLHQLFRTIETSGKPFVAAINGTALGGGYELCLACHHRIALDHPSVKVGLPEVQLGLMPGAGGTQRLPRMIGYEEALPLLLEGKHLKAQQAHEKGLVDDLASSPEDLLEKARDWIHHMGTTVKPWDEKGFRIPGGDVHGSKGFRVFSSGPALTQDKTMGNYPAPKYIFNSVYEGLPLAFDRGMEVEARYFTKCALSVEAQNMIRTLFFTKNKADSGIDRPKEEEVPELTKIGVLGAGMMGAGIAYVTAQAGLDVVLKDVSKDNAEKGKDYSRKIVEKQKKRGRMDDDKANRLLERIHPTDQADDLAGCELVIEAVFEDRKLKAQVTQEAEAQLTGQAVFASNTSTLPISGLAEASERPGNFIGLHFFSPVDKMPLVEVILGEQTSDYALALAIDYVKRIRKTPIVVNDSRGFYTSRIFKTYVSEGMELLNDGVKPALIENAARMAGMPVGPLAVTDEVSIELIYRIAKQAEADGYAEQGARLKIANQFVNELGRLGKKNKKGFYEYPEEGDKYLWPELERYYPPKEEQPSVAEVKKRILHAQAVESVRCLEENIIRKPEDADLGSILGWGFPAYTGGVLSYIDMVGPQQFVAECDRFAQQLGSRFDVPDLLRKMAEKQERFYGQKDSVAV